VIYEEAKNERIDNFFTFPVNPSTLPLRLREGMREGGVGGDECRGRLFLFSYQSIYLDSVGGS
jgi:hypothetical protein